MTLNLTWDMTANACSGLINWSTCETECLRQSIQHNFEFVWIFVIAFIFSELSKVIFRIKTLDIHIRLAVSKGLAIGGYFLTVAGILYFLIMVI